MPVRTKVLPSSGPPSARRSALGELEAQAPLAQPLDQLQGRLVGELLAELLGQDRADPLDLLDLPRRRRRAGRRSCRSARRAPGRSRSRCRAARARRGRSRTAAAWSASISSIRLRAEISPNPSSSGEPLGREVVDVGRVARSGPRRGSASRSSPPAPRCPSTPRKCFTCWKVCPGQPRRFGQIVHTESSGLTVGVPHAGHFFGGLALSQPLALAALDQRRDHLRDHVAGARDHDLVALADVLARQVLLVVQGGGRDRDAADVDRLEHRERQQPPGAADVPDDLVQLRRRGDRRELPGDRPARLAAGDPELPPQRRAGRP